jgi:hypothetical protein
MTIDERIRFLVQSTESLHASLEREVEERRNQRKEQEERWGRLNKAIRAAVLAYFGENGNEP